MIGDEPELIVDLENQKNFIKVDQMILPYKKFVFFSEDLLSGKRKNVFDTAVTYYYQQACAVAVGIVEAKKYRSRINTTVREIQ